MCFLAGDIGGTNTFLSLLDDKFKVIKEQTYPSQNYSSLESIIIDFVENRKIKAACLAIAGPVLQGKCKITNLAWAELDEEKLQQDLGIEKVSLINDFVAQGYNIVLDKNKEIYTLQEGNFDLNSPIAIMGAGTGLGKAFAIPIRDDNFKVFPTEGGHGDYAPRNELENRLLSSLRPKYQSICQEKFNLSQPQIKMLSLDEEAILSGSGIIDIFHVLKADFESSLAEEILSQLPEKQAEIISISANNKTNQLAEKTMEVFIEVYGAIAGNFALNLLCFGGLYIAGGIAAKNIDLIKEKKTLFLDAFNSKVRVNPALLQQIPIHIILNELSGLNGAINYLTQM